MVESARYLRPKDLGQALVMAGRFEPQFMAGGTDFYPAMADRTIRGDVLDLSAVPELRKIIRLQRGGRHFLRIGAMVSWSDVLHHPELSSRGFLALRQCAREVGGRQIQNRATLVGNVCNASPAADGIPVLMALGANLEIRSSESRRWMPLESFVEGPRKVALAPGEIVTAIELPVEAAPVNSLFLKIGSRRYLVISITMLAAQWRRGKNGLCRIAVGACSPVARRLAPLETWYLDGMPAAQKAKALEASLNLLSPIDDVRADQDYRRDLASALCEKLVLEMKAEAARV
jgi:CO/xanthine dehydrogenase FAD-binding subunit